MYRISIVEIKGKKSLQKRRKLEDYINDVGCFHFPPNIVRWQGLVTCKALLALLSDPPLPPKENSGNLLCKRLN
jgi:hypothetical protein